MFKELVHKADLGNGYYMNPILGWRLCRSGSFPGRRNVLSDGFYRPIPARFVNFQVKGSRKLEIDLPSLGKI